MIVIILVGLSYVQNASNMLQNASNDVQAQQSPEKINILTENTTYILQNKVLQNQALEFYNYTDIIVKNNQFENVSFSIMDSTNVVFENNSFIRSPDITLTFWGIENLTIYNNSIVDSAETALQIFETANAKITFNSFYLADVNSNYFALNVGVKIDRSENTVFVNNIVACPLGDGLYVFNSPNSEITSNTITNSGFIAISVILSSGTILANNQLLESSSYVADDAPLSSGLTISDCENMSVYNNYIYHSTDVGINIDLVKNSIIENNTIRDHPIGIFVGRSTNLIISMNVYIEVEKTIIVDQSVNINIISDTTNTDNSSTESDKNDIEDSSSTEIDKSTTNSPKLMIITLILLPIFRRLYLKKL